MCPHFAAVRLLPAVKAPPVESSMDALVCMVPDCDRPLACVICGMLDDFCIICDGMTSPCAPAVGVHPPPITSHSLATPGSSARGRVVVRIFKYRHLEGVSKV